MFTMPYKRIAKTLVVAAVLLAACRGALADHTVFQKVAPSAVLIINSDSTGLAGFGSGVLVDHEQKVVLTAAHVVADMLEFKVVFPESQGGRIITSAMHYIEKDAGIEAELLAIDRKRDVALLKLPSVPAGVPAIRVADDSPLPGETIFAIGNSSLSEGGMFGIVNGMIRHVYKHPHFGITVINSSVATNRGDSGGPVVNTDGVLVGIVSNGTTGSGEGIQLVDYSIDVTEIRTVLKTAGVGDYRVVPAANAAVADSLLTQFDWETLRIIENSQLGSSNTTEANSTALGTIVIPEGLLDWPLPEPSQSPTAKPVNKPKDPLSQFDFSPFLIDDGALSSNRKTRKSLDRKTHEGKSYDLHSKANNKVR